MTRIRVRRMYAWRGSARILAGRGVIVPQAAATTGRAAATERAATGTAAPMRPAAAAREGAKASLDIVDPE